MIDPVFANMAFVKMFLAAMLMAVANGLLLIGDSGNPGATVWVMAESSSWELKLYAAYRCALFFVTALMSVHYIDEWKRLYAN